MTPERWQQVQEVFCQLAALPTMECRQALDALASDDPEMCREVESLLAADAAARDSDPVAAAVAAAFAEVAHFDAVEFAAATAAPTPGEALENGTHIGPYRLLREIGRGGMGTAYLAERDDGHYCQPGADGRPRPEHGVGRPWAVR